MTAIMDTPVNTGKRKSKSLSERAKSGIRGLLLVVKDEVRSNTLPLTPEESMDLLGEIIQLSVVYTARSQLTMKLFYLAFRTSTLLVVISRWTKVIYWADAEANLLELEASARQLASTSHLKSSGSFDYGFGIVRGSVSEATESAPSSQNPSNHKHVMNWNDATAALEAIMSKVLAQSQSAKLIDRLMAAHNVNRDAEFDLQTFTTIGTQLLEKVPHKVLRTNLTSELNQFIGRMS
jgi:hypothetical protein